MKYLKITLIVFAIAIFFYSCGTKCDGVACTTSPPVMILDFRDKAGRDLLNPTTPFHYDTLRMKLLNASGLISFIKQGTVAPNKERIKMVLNWSMGENITYLKLTDNDQDTIFTNYQKTTAGCCANYQLQLFKYNTKTYTDSVANRYFTINK
ncbi:hypothetical protein HQ865_06950 [Mucilaginibacter mali]|uniref:Lipoprotein n=1 Tax=Mucilaginibacter mali TaxID=2740462 RepID=A0A7D4UJR3_9SPHI|nr:hypothetical protein [Mucilaginibacter mali]QKJ29502.1 hypothetical protein HQ865_06950 [Mucilaginibacter mali]